MVAGIKNKFVNNQGKLKAKDANGSLFHHVSEAKQWSTYFKIISNEKEVTKII